MSLESTEPLILYATETGTAQDAADYIARQCHRIHLKPRVLDMDVYQPVSFMVFFEIKKQRRLMDSLP